MSTCVARSSSPRLATVLLVLAVALCISNAASGKRYIISNAALNSDRPPGHDNGGRGVPALAAAVTAGGNPGLLRHHQEQASARVDVGVKAPVSIGVGTMSSINEVRHQLHA
jgi:hypothetical protein